MEDNEELKPMTMWEKSIFGAAIAGGMIGAIALGGVVGGAIGGGVGYALLKIMEFVFSKIKKT